MGCIAGNQVTNMKRMIVIIIYLLRKTKEFADPTPLTFNLTKIHLGFFFYITD